MIDVWPKKAFQIISSFLASPGPPHSVSLGNLLSRALGGGHDALRRSRGGGLGSLGWHRCPLGAQPSQAQSSRMIQISMRRSRRCIFREWAAGCSRQAAQSTRLSTRRRMSCISKRRLCAAVAECRKMNLASQKSPKKANINAKRNAEILEIGVVLVAESLWVKEQREIVRFQHAGRIVATCAW